MNSLYRIQEPQMSVYQVRQINGCLTRVPDKFNADVWLILDKSRRGIHFGGQHLPREPTLSQMTSNEACFANLVEELLNGYSTPEYKSLVIELLCALAAILKRNPELDFAGKLCVDALIGEAVAMFKRDQEIPCDEMSVFYNSPVATTSGYLARAVVNNVLKGSIFGQASGGEGKANDYSCPVQ